MTIRLWQDNILFSNFPKLSKQTLAHWGTLTSKSKARPSKKNMFQTANLKVTDIFKKPLLLSIFFFSLIWLVNFSLVLLETCMTIELKHRENLKLSISLPISNFGKRLCVGFWIVCKFYAFLLFQCLE